MIEYGVGEMVETLGHPPIWICPHGPNGLRKYDYIVSEVECRQLRQGHSVTCP